MTIFHIDKQTTQDIKKFLSPNTQGKLLDKSAVTKAKAEPNLAIRGQSTPAKKGKK